MIKCENRKVFFLNKRTPNIFILLIITSVWWKWKKNHVSFFPKTKSVMSLVQSSFFSVKKYSSFNEGCLGHWQLCIRNPVFGGHSSKSLYYSICPNVQCPKGHFTVVFSVPWPLNRSKAGGDLVLLRTFLLFMSNWWYSHANKLVNISFTYEK